MSFAAEYETEETLGADRGDIPATRPYGYESSGGAGDAVSLHSLTSLYRTKQFSPKGKFVSITRQLEKSETLILETSFRDCSHN